jgi:hypothetical protein
MAGAIPVSPNLRQSLRIVNTGIIIVNNVIVIVNT